MKKRLLSAFLILVMLVGVLPVGSVGAATTVVRSCWLLCILCKLRDLLHRLCAVRLKNAAVLLRELLLKADGWFRTGSFCHAAWSRT